MMKRLELALEKGRRQGALGDLDVHFARLIAEHDESPPVVLAAALLSQLASIGHVCLDLAALEGQPIVDELALPPLNELLDALHAHPACGGPDDYTPLVLDGTRLYMRRYFDYEVAVADAWRESAAATTLSPSLESELERLFPHGTNEDRMRDQRAAAAYALTHRRVLISGGPGTGKTTTLASILALLLSRQADLKILLAAPTGKAAARMQDAIRGAKTRLPLSDEIKIAMPEVAQTLHRLLGARPQGGGMAWRHGPDDPLDCDVLVVDEASMIDLALMARLLSALPPQACIVLLGDRDQLASVEAGAVFADLCSLGAAVLSVSFRFGTDGGIGRLASLVRAGDADGMMQLLREDGAEVRWLPEPNRAVMVDAAAATYQRFIEDVEHFPMPQIFERFASFRVLTPMRKGPLGVASLNTEIEKRLVARNAIPPRSRWYVGRPVMIAANDYGLRLFNGDIGICVRDPANGELRVAFPAEAGDGVRLMAPARLPAHETAWAMTVHKSQGSEFDCVSLVLADDATELVTRELLYTAITRARQSVVIHASVEALRSCCMRRIARHTGLVARLQNR
ncbi:MAG TPA: AAA family ATPase [Rhodocyclaceae bacterium]|nr:AAA family ATPase [Rhodocyclaceae bacterium]